MFGPHLIIDGTRCDTQKLGDRILIEQILSDYPTAIGMTKIGGPYMFEYQAPDPAYSGVSGIVVIAESHIAIHTFPALDYFTMDIFSCKNFDHEKAIRYIKEALDVREMDRMLVQRGLSFRGPHHGAEGATDELIAAAEARLSAGIVSTETVTAEEAAAARARLLAQRAGTPAHGPAESDTAAGQMIWPQYGVTPDVGTYGAEAIAAPTAQERTEDAAQDEGADACETCARGDARIVPLNAPQAAPVGVNGEALAATEPVQVNPTASISGLLDKLGGIGLGGRAMSRVLAEWERLARDPGCSLALALSTPVVALGLRELLVYAIEHRYADVVVATGEDVFADLHEALGHFHYVDGGEMVVTEDDRARTAAFIGDFASTLAEDQDRIVGSGREFLQALGEALPSRAPRKGLLQAAAAGGVPVYAPDLLAGPVGAALLAARTRGADVCLDPLEDLTALARDLKALPRAGTICVGRGLPEAYLAQAGAVAGEDAPEAAGSVYIGAEPDQASAGTAMTDVDPAVALPLLVSGLAQRIRGRRGHTSRTRHAGPAVAAEPEEDRILA
ncbi:MAG TPA: adenosylmethionine decarboxylase [Ktedonobacterales bacterium]